jgi:hypothetical protein
MFFYILSDGYKGAGEHGGTSGTCSEGRAGAGSLIALLDGGQNARDTGHDLRV